ncbi:hypothetical protein HUW63_27270 [Myxococcus sp. AM001]|nr:hypothetical protein [Myxococcus sp. AM001]
MGMTGPSRFYILEWLVLDGYCAIFNIPEGMPRIHKPARGIRMGAEYPDGLRFNMTRHEPGLKIADVIPNAVNYFMVSKRMKELLEQHSSADIEFLQFVLLNHRGRVASEDMEKTEGDPAPMKPDRFMYLRRLLLQEKKGAAWSTSWPIHACYSRIGAVAATVHHLHQGSMTTQPGSDVVACVSFVTHLPHARRSWSCKGAVATDFSPWSGRQASTRRHGSAPH